VNARPFVLTAASIFLLVAVLHLARLVGRIPVRLGDVDVPVGFSWAGLVASLALAVWGFRVARR
jgi:hypothetical protein